MLNTYNVNASEKKDLLEDFDKLKKELVEIEQKLLVEALEDREMFSEYLELPIITNQKNLLKNTLILMSEV